MALLGCDGMHTVGGKTAEEVFGLGPQATLAAAACQGDIASMHEAMRQGADVDRSGYGGTTPLMWAMSCDGERGFEELLKMGANPNKYINGSVNPITLASTYDNGFFLKTLLNNGGDSNSVDLRDGRRALDLAFLKGVEDNDWSNFDLILASGVDVNRVDEMGSTSVEFFAKLNRFDVVYKILERGGYTHNIPHLRLITETAIIDESSELSVYRDKVEDRLRNL